MKTNRTLKKALAVVLCISMTLCLIPAGANAADNTTEQAAEVVSLREENVKHFDMGDGTYQAIAYSHPVHEMDSEGNWQDIDFSMNLTQIKGVRAYTNAAGAAFAANYTANQPLMTLSGEGTSIAMTLVSNANTATMSTQAMTSTATVAAELTATQTQIQTFEDAQAASFSNTLLYENVMPGIDLEYIVDPWTVKENIIVNQPASKYEYRFKLDLNGLYPVLQEDGSILIYNSATDEAEYEIPAPYMYDATGEMSFDVSYGLSGSNGIYYLTVTADEDWINTDEREFPVVIDPSYVSSAEANKDTYITGDLPDAARGSYQFFFVGENEVAYIVPPTPTLPAGTTLYWAALGVYYFYKDHVASGYTDITAHQVNGMSWSENTLTWNDVYGIYSNFGLSLDQLGETVRTYGYVDATSVNPRLVAFDITEAVRSWIRGTRINLGIGLMRAQTSMNRSVLFRSTEGATNYRPQLTYRYGTADPVHLEIIYDQAYNSRFPNPQARIFSQAKTLKNYFLDELGIIVTLSYPKTFSSFADAECSTSYSSICTCSTDDYSCENSTATEEHWLHHTNIYNILYHLPQPSESTNIVMAFVGYETCAYISGFHCTNPCKGLSYAQDSQITITNFGGSETETVTMIHEMGHMFGIIDHYNINCASTDQLIRVLGDDEYNENCLYGESGWQTETLAEITICEGCRNRIDENREKYNG